MNDLNLAFIDLDSPLQLGEQTSLVFVEDAEYEFVGGGAAIANGY